METDLSDLSEIYLSLFIFFSSLSGPFQVRCKSVVGPFLRREPEWEVNGSCYGKCVEIVGIHVKTIINYAFSFMVSNIFVSLQP